MRIVDKIALDNAIAQLPDGYKNVFVLHDVEGFEHEEVAKILGAPSAPPSRSSTSATKTAKAAQEKGESASSRQLGLRSSTYIFIL